jgi:uroporphyrinogen-III decarboxylase
VSLHICGNAKAILPGMATSGADVLELDHAVDLSKACRIVGPHIGLWGNLDPVGIIARGTPEQVQHAAQQALAAVQAAGHSRFVLSSGCTLAVETPSANLEALIRLNRCGVRQD